MKKKGIKLVPHKNFFLIIIIGLILKFTIHAQEIPSERVVDFQQLSEYLKEDVKDKFSDKGKVSSESLALYFREKFSERFFYDYHTVDQRINRYNKVYHSQEIHKSRALDHMGKFSDKTMWKLPFNYLNGEEVNAYALRHLARQHKMVDVALHYFNENKDPKYLNYFTNQQISLNEAFINGQYEKIEDGNGVYEAFRSGYRILNWLWIHNLFLGEEEYSDEEQLMTIATLLQHGAHLYQHNEVFRSGNHQTRGMSALAMLSIILRDFKDTDLWFTRSMKILEQHLSREINDDGFQFERSVHYHMSDINNFFYVYQLAKISGIEVGEVWEQKLRSLFTTLVKIAYPDKTAPVLQDDTEIPWGEKNEISEVMTLGYLLFEDPVFGYFATDRVDRGIYWFLQDKQLNLLQDIERKKPGYGSLHFPNTHYYIMREGWDKNDNMMVISAGLDDKKPDHQHGDMLGIQAIANGHAILPNYQVRYSLKDFEFFKNSMVKNVALVDNELQGKEWTSNKGGSGFGKFRLLPEPKTISWDSNDGLDLFIGSHNGFENIGVDYSRQVIYVRNDFWIVKDNFKSDQTHTYKQVWQGHYTHEAAPRLIRSTFEDASGCDIYQLNPVNKVESSGMRGKQWSVVSKEGASEFSFVTIVFPYKSYNNRIDEDADHPEMKGWKINDSQWNVNGAQAISVSKENEAFVFGIREVSYKSTSIRLDKDNDFFIKFNEGQISIKLLGEAKCKFSVNSHETDFQNEKEVYVLEPGEELIVKLSEE